MRTGLLQHPLHLQDFPTSIFAMRFAHNKSDKHFILLSLYFYISHSDK